MFNFGAIGQGVAGTIQAVMGYRQSREGSKLRKKGERLQQEAWDKRTDFEIPEEIKKNYAAATNEAYAKPAVQRYMEESADRQLANNISAVGQYATSGADALAAAFAANQQSLAGKNQAAVAGAEARQQNMGRMYDTGNVLADYKSLAWDMNVNVPFLQRLQWSQDLIGAGYGMKQAGDNQFVEGHNAIGQSMSNFFSMQSTPAGGGGAAGGQSGGGGDGGMASMMSMAG